MKIAVQREIQEKEATATRPQETEKEGKARPYKRAGVTCHLFPYWTLLAMFLGARVLCARKTLNTVR